MKVGGWVGVDHVTAHDANPPQWRKVIEDDQH
jgi:hypothetical protein